MKRTLIFLCFFIQMNILFANNYIQNNNSINFNYKDTCKIVKLNYLENERIIIINEYYKLHKELGYKFNNIIYIDEKKINDSTSLYVITSGIYLDVLLLYYPSYYYLTDSSIICIYTGKENSNKVNYNCIKPFYEDAKYYSIDLYQVISWENLIFKRDNICILDDKSVNMIFKIIKGKIIYKEFYYKRLYNRKMNRNVKIYDKDGVLLKYYEFNKENGVKIYDLNGILLEDYEYIQDE